MTRPPLVFLCLALVLGGSATIAAQTAPGSSTKASALDYGVFRDRVQPVFLNKRAGLARCYVCHSQGTPFRLQRLSTGATSWNEEETKKNFDAIQRLIAPGSPEKSRLLLMPLAHEAGGTEFHPGGKRWTSKDDAEWKEIAQWVRNASR